jgi:O-phosphoseryl-tRNA(Cys) synthetase
MVYGSGLRCREAGVLELRYHGSCVTVEQPEVALPQSRAAAESCYRGFGFPDQDPRFPDGESPTCKL